LLHQLLSESASCNPHQTAIVGSGATLSYGELDLLSNQIANQLRADGIRIGDRIGLFLPKCELGVAALFGIQKAGAAYVPIDPQAPPERAAYILRNCAVRGLVSSSDRLPKLPLEFLSSEQLESVLLVDDRTDLVRGRTSQQTRITSFSSIRATQSTTNPQVPVTDNHLAYILYTSGSTGEPKGVMISHLNSLTFVNWCYDEFGVRPSDRVSNHAPFHFDLSVFDLFCTVKAGGTVFLVPQEIASFPVRLAKWIAEQGITIWYSVPSALVQLVEHGKLETNDYKALRTVLFAGEVFPMKYLRKLVQHLPTPIYYNLYGPTETNVCTYYKVQPADLVSDRTEPVPIGKACANTEVVAVDHQMQPVAEGQEGELYVRSSTIMKGYWGRPESTAKCVVADFLNPHYSDALYRTGDIVRSLPGGEYAYVGRRDKMIKSRGYRIELGEIEAALYAHPGVKEAAVIAVPDEHIGARIKAYVVPHDGLKRMELEKFCLLRLPKYMMPEWIEFRAELPRTSTGKVDKTSLEKERLHVA
jgi:L-proline---[L-prolyl-carrier protein] ligase